MAAKILRGRAGLTLMEIAVSLGIVVLAVFGMTGILVHSGRSSDRTQAQSGLDSDVALAGERVQGYLMEARSVTIDGDGLGLTYKYPTKNPDGTYTSDPTAVESTSRRLYVSNGVLYSSDEPDRPILTDVPDVDPETSTAMRVFSVGLNIREVQVRLVSERTIAGGSRLHSAITTRIGPRNIAQP